MYFDMSKNIYIFYCMFRYLNESSSVESISTKLRQVCPSIYHSEDAACAKVNITVIFFFEYKLIKLISI